MNIIDLLIAHGISPARVSMSKGGEYHSACPGCGGKDRCCSWPATHDGQGSFWCRRCGKGGDAIQFLREFDGLSFRDALEKLGLSSSQYLVSQYKAPSSPKALTSSNYSPEVKTHPDIVVNPALWREKALKFVDTCHELLIDNDKALGWLARRGITTETAVRFKIGLNPGKDGAGSPDFRPWKSWGLQDVKNDKGRQRTLVLPAGIIVPHIIGGEVLRIRVRLANPKDNEKYRVVLGSVMGTMLLNQECKAFVVLETELDAFLLIQEVGDIVGAVALGSVAVKPDTTTVLVLRNALKILNTLDFDAAGANASSWWRDTFPQSKRWPVPKGKDPGDAWKAGVDLRAWTLAGLPPIFTIGQEPDPVPATTSKLPNPIKELYLLLQQSHVTIHRHVENGDGGLEIKEDHVWAKENWDTSKKISKLVFYDDNVYEYLCNHPAAVISGHNFKTTIKK